MNEPITMRTRLSEVYRHPVGHDILQKLLITMKLPGGLLTSPLPGSLSLKTVAGLSSRYLDSGFWDTFLKLLNSEKDRPKEAENGSESARKWWKEAVFYQIYPRSFADSNKDGMGDIPGIIGKLDYLKGLGIDAVWLSPIYDSPCDDNGYDIRDYCRILKEFGTMEDFDSLLQGLHDRDMKLVMDLVVNHTSDEHRWFKEALTDPASPYRDYYFFRRNNGETAPNNWTSFFSGSAWNYYEEQDEWALHLFSRKQMDLNWDNPSVREDIYRMIRWWLEKGVDGFRMDVINYISKEEGLPQGNEKIGELMGYCGIEHYFYGPRLHEYLLEIREKAFDPFDAFSVGETPGTGMQMARLLTGQPRHELDMVFNFDHLETPGHMRFDVYRYDLNYLKKYYMDWMENYGSQCWMALFYDNHDNPRMLSKVDPPGRYTAQAAKLLAVIQLTLKGTPFLYQGQEIGAVNETFRGIEEIKDVESLNLYRELCRTMSQEAALRKVLAGTRDHARGMMKWERVQEQKKDRDSVYYCYKKLIAIRKREPALVYGSVEFKDRDRKNILCYFRKGEDGSSFYVECNLGSSWIRRPVRPEGYRGILSNYARHGGFMHPYEVCLYRKTDERDS